MGLSRKQRVTVIDDEPQFDGTVTPDYDLLDSPSPPDSELALEQAEDARTRSYADHAREPIAASERDLLAARDAEPLDPPAAAEPSHADDGSAVVASPARRAGRPRGHTAALALALTVALAGAIAIGHGLRPPSGRDGAQPSARHGGGDRRPTTRHSAERRSRRHPRRSKVPARRARPARIRHHRHVRVPVATAPSTAVPAPPLAPPVSAPPPHPTSRRYAPAPAPADASPSRPGGEFVIGGP